MKKLKFDTLFESLMLSEATHPKEQRFANIKFNLSKILEILEDKESEDYANVAAPYIKTWENQKYLGNLDHDKIQKILGHIITIFEERVEEGKTEISYPELKSIVNEVINDRSEFETSGTHKNRWISKFVNLFEKLKTAHTSFAGEDDIFDSNDGAEPEEDFSNTKTYLAAKDKLLNFIQATDSTPQTEAIDFLVRKIGADPSKASDIIDTLINSGDLVRNEEGNLEVSRQTKEIESFGVVPDDADEGIETGIPFKDIPEYEGEDEDVDAAIRSSMEDDEDFTRSGKNW